MQLTEKARACVANSLAYAAQGKQKAAAKARADAAMWLARAMLLEFKPKPPG